MDNITSNDILSRGRDVAASRLVTQLSVMRASVMNKDLTELDKLVAEYKEKSVSVPEIDRQTRCLKRFIVLETRPRSFDQEDAELLVGYLEASLPDLGFDKGELMLLHLSIAKQEERFMLGSIHTFLAHIDATVKAKKASEPAWQLNDIESDWLVPSAIRFVKNYCVERKTVCTEPSDRITTFMGELLSTAELLIKTLRQVKTRSVEGIHFTGANDLSKSDGLKQEFVDNVYGVVFNQLSTVIEEDCLPLVVGTKKVLEDFLTRETNGQEEEDITKDSDGE